MKPKINLSEENYEEIREYMVTYFPMRPDITEIYEECKSDKEVLNSNIELLKMHIKELELTNNLNSKRHKLMTNVFIMIVLILSVILISLGICYSIHDKKINNMETYISSHNIDYNVNSQ